MVSINKYLTIAIVASVLLGAAFAQTQEQPTTEAPAPEAAPQGPGFIGGLGNKLISGLKSASKAVLSHVPFLNRGAGAATNDSPAGEETTEAPATEVPAAEAASTEASSTEASASEAPATEALAAEAASTEAPATEAAQAASEQPQAEEQKSE